MVKIIESLGKGQISAAAEGRKFFIRNRVGLAWPRKELPDDQLDQGRNMLNISREGENDFRIGMIEAYLIIHNPDSTKKEKVKAGERWRDGALLQVIASLDPISEGKKKKNMPVYVEDVEIKARDTIRAIALKKGGTEEQAQHLANKLTNMTKHFQIKNGVINNTKLPVNSDEV